MAYRILLFALVFMVLCAPAFAADGPAITDRTGERWPLDQAVTLGFDPDDFNFGLGRHAFTPLGPEDVEHDPWAAPRYVRVIGYAHGGEALAVSVGALTHSETANVTVGGEPVTIAY